MLTEWDNWMTPPWDSCSFSIALFFNFLLTTVIILLSDIFTVNWKSLAYRNKKTLICTSTIMPVTAYIAALEQVCILWKAYIPGLYITPACTMNILSKKFEKVANQIWYWCLPNIDYSTHQYPHDLVDPRLSQQLASTHTIVYFSPSLSTVDLPAPTLMSSFETLTYAQVDNITLLSPSDWTGLFWLLSGLLLPSLVFLRWP